MIAGHLREKDGHYYCVLSYTDYTGERKQIWKATDFEENRITINHTVTEARVDGETVIIASDRTKTKSSYRSFPMSDTVREKLLAWREVQKPYATRFFRWSGENF